LGKLKKILGNFLNNNGVSVLTVYEQKFFKQKITLDNFSDDELYGSTRFPRSAVICGL